MAPSPDLYSGFGTVGEDGEKPCLASCEATVGLACDPASLRPGQLKCEGLWGSDQDLDVAGAGLP